MTELITIIIGMVIGIASIFSIMYMMTKIIFDALK